MPNSVIWKYPIYGAGSVDLNLCAGFIVRHVAVQRGVPTLWIEVDPKAPVYTFRFHSVGTGRTIPVSKDPLEYVGTYLNHGDSEVYHVHYERRIPHET